MRRIDYLFLAMIAFAAAVASAPPPPRGPAAGAWLTGHVDRLAWRDADLSGDLTPH